MNVMLDERTRSALARLTESEKECLRRRLLPQTAKEMAIDLGVSPHAIEKRLKMARAKLGIGSSLEVARMLAAMEDGYGRAVPEMADLAGGGEHGQASTRAARQLRRLAFAIAIAGALSMILIYAAVSLFAAQDGRQKLSFDEATAYLEAAFDRGDKDKSGYLDDADKPSIMVQGPDDKAPRQIEGNQFAKMWFGQMDANGDDKVSREEYINKLRPGLMKRGIPSKPPQG